MLLVGMTLLGLLCLFTHGRLLLQLPARLPLAAESGRPSWLQSHRGGSMVRAMYGANCLQQCCVTRPHLLSSACTAAAPCCPRAQPYRYWLT